MKKLLFISVIFCFISCKNPKPPVYEKEEMIPTDTIPQPMPKVNLEVIPGKSIGNIALEQNADTLTFLGPADLSDAAMGKAWLTWYSTNSKLVNGKSELNVYTTYKDDDMNEKVVRQIRVTSPDFKTLDGLNVGKSFSDISLVMPNLDLLGSFRKPGTTTPVELYDDTDLGIAFEIENTGSEKTCIAMIIHPKGKKATDQYIYFHPDLVKP